MSISSVNSSNQYLYNYGSSTGTTQKTASKTGSGENPFFSKVDTNQDGTVDKSELQSLVDSISANGGQTIDANSQLSKYDTDGDGKLNDSELRSFMEGNNLRPAEAHHGHHAESANAQTDASSQTTASTQTGTDTSSTNDFNATEYLISMLSSLQNYLLGTENSDSSQSSNQSGVQASSPYQSNYGQIMQKTQSQYSAQA